MLPTKFICLTCGQPSVLKRVSTTETVDFIGVEVCKCKGVLPEKVVKKNNVISFLLEKEKKNLKKEKK